MGQGQLARALAQRAFDLRRRLGPVDERQSVWVVSREGLAALNATPQWQQGGLPVIVRVDSQTTQLLGIPVMAISPAPYDLLLLQVEA
jgi:hypothetical protein